MQLGGSCLGSNTYRFTVWSPFARGISVRIVSPVEMLVPLKPGERGYWTADVTGIPSPPSYLYRIDDSKERPDPASHFQPEGVHKPSQVVDHSAFAWGDAAWKGIDLESAIFYELHTGTFTPQGTFAGVISKIPYLKALGITVIEIMPVAQFPGNRNWGYDGTYTFAVQNSYGGPRGLKELVNACHAAGLGVCLDVVYNHFGPEGFYALDFAPYFTHKYRSPWGDAVNFDGEYSDGVREFFYENALFWFEDYHIDVLRLDALHSLPDFSAQPFLRTLADKVRAVSVSSGKRFYLVAESDLNDTRLLRSASQGGFGLDAQWNDDFHHALHALLTGEKNGYYVDFGGVECLAKSLREGYVFTGQYSEYRKRSQGSPSGDLPCRSFVVFSQNHDQVGNRMLGERLSHLVDLEMRKLAAGIVLLSPYLPLLFMGEEFGAGAPFQYFVSHGDRDLIEAVRQGRKREFKDFVTAREVPDPQSEGTFERSRLDWENAGRGEHAMLLDWYRMLIALRKTIPALASLSRENTFVTASEEGRLILMERRHPQGRAVVLFNFGDNTFENAMPLPEGKWRKILSASKLELYIEGD